MMHKFVKILASLPVSAATAERSVCRDSLKCYRRLQIYPHVVLYTHAVKWFGKG